jgi:hypothetical protein
LTHHRSARLQKLAESIPGLLKTFTNTGSGDSEKERESMHERKRKENANEKEVTCLGKNLTGWIRRRRRQPGCSGGKMFV